MDKQRLIYGIGGTGSSIVSKFKNISEDSFNDECIFRVWDIDHATNNLDNISDTEKVIITGDSIRSLIRRIKEDKHNNQDLFNQIHEVFPTEDDNQINKLPSTRGIGAAKQPIVSRLVGTIERNKIASIIKSDCEIAQTGVTGNAYLVLSPCGGTSTGFHIQIVSELIKNNYNVYLFFVSPNFYDELAPNAAEANHSNTVATFLRLYYDLEKKKIIYSADGIQNIDSEIYPFIIESEWGTGKNRAEFQINSETYNTSIDYFYAYNAYAILSFFKANECASNFASQHQNRLNDINEQNSYFNMLLLYPTNKTRENTKKVIYEAIKKKNGLGAIKNLTNLLSEKNPEYEIVYNAKSVKNAIVALFENKSHSYSIGDISEILNWCINFLDSDSVRNKWASTRNNAQFFNFNDEEDTGEKKNGLLKRIIKNFWGNDDEDEVENTVVNVQQLSTNQTENIRELYNFLSTSINNFNKNISVLDTKVELPFNSVDFDNSVPVKPDFKSGELFEDKFVENYISKAYDNKGSNNTDLPPSLKDWGDNKHLIYPKAVTIHENVFLLTIHSEIPDSALAYLRGKYLKDFIESKKKGYLSYPDKRLNGIFSPGDESFVEFFDWERQTISTLHTENSKSISTNTEVSIICLALISDNIDTGSVGTKILDLNYDNVTKMYFIESTINEDSNAINIIGHQTKLWNETAQHFLKKLRELARPDELGLTEGITVDINKLVEDSKNQIFDFCNKHNTQCFKLADEKIKKLKALLIEPGIEMNQTALVFIEQINIYLNSLVAEYKQSLNTQSEDIGPELND